MSTAHVTCESRHVYFINLSNVCVAADWDSLCHESFMALGSHWAHCLMVWHDSQQSSCYRTWQGHGSKPWHVWITLNWYNWRHSDHGKQMQAEWSTPSRMNDVCVVLGTGRIIHHHTQFQSQSNWLAARDAQVGRRAVGALSASEDHRLLAGTSNSFGQNAGLEFYGILCSPAFSCTLACSASTSLPLESTSPCQKNGNM